MFATCRKFKDTHAEGKTERKIQLSTSLLRGALLIEIVEYGIPNSTLHLLTWIKAIGDGNPLVQKMFIKIITTPTSLSYNVHLKPRKEHADY